MTRSANNLSYEEISQYFSCPIHQACIYLDVERNELKKRCIELNIKKWPYRQFQRKKVPAPEGMFGSFFVDTNPVIFTTKIENTSFLNSSQKQTNSKELLERISISNLLA
jgi:hypothetical protein